jgi:hypothetical protein
VDGREDYGIEGGRMMCAMFVEQEVGGIRLSQGLKFSLNQPVELIKVSKCLVVDGLLSKKGIEALSLSLSWRACHSLS